jgi:hypothetical protein
MGSERAGKAYGAEVLKGNTSQVYFQHAGGDTLPTSQVEIKVNGHRDAWGIYPHHNSLELEDGPIDDSTDAAPQPDFRQNLGTNDRAELGSGESWNVIAANMATRVPYGYSNGPSDHPKGDDALQRPPAEEKERFPVRAGKQYLVVGMLKSSSGYPEPGETLIEIYEEESVSPSGSYNSPYESGIGVQLGKGDDVSVVWTAESGGKTQTLYEYTAQHPATDEKFTPP